MLKFIAILGVCTLSLYSVALSQPEIQFVTPEHREIFPTGTHIYVVVEAESPGRTIAYVDFYVNNQFVRRETNARYIWGKNDEKLKNLETGTYTLRAVTYDSEGDSAVAIQKLFIQEPKYDSGGPPDVFITHPAPGSRWQNETDLAVKVVAFDEETSIQYVRLFLDNVFVGEKTRYPYQWEGNGVLQDLSGGGHTLRAEAMDYGGFTRTTEIQIQVDAESDIDSTDWIFLEVECADKVEGSVWKPDSTLAGTPYVASEFCVSSRDEAPNGEEQQIRFTFTPRESGTYTLLGRTRALDHSRDSYWVRWNEGEWVKWDHLFHSSSFVWNQVLDADKGYAPLEISLTAGESHQLDIAYREGGVFLDAVCLSRSGLVPEGEGAPALNCESPQTNTGQWDGILKSLNLYLAPTYLMPGHIPTLFTESHQTAKLRLRLTDIQGRLKWEDQWLVNPGKQNYPVEVSGLSGGVYRLAIYSSEGGVVSFPLLVK